jgi:hypothetical protein
VTEPVVQILCTERRKVRFEREAIARQIQANDGCHGAMILDPSGEQRRYVVSTAMRPMCRLNIKRKNLFRCWESE